MTIYMLSLLVLIQRSHGITFVITVGDKKGKGHIERAEKGVIPCYKPIQAKDEKGRAEKGNITTNKLLMSKV